MKVLVGVDKSEESQTALRYACHLMEHFDAKVDAVYVKPDETDVGGDTLYAPFVGKKEIKAWIEKEAESVAEQVLGSCEVCDAGKIPCWPRTVIGEPAEEILNIAHTEGYDLIVLGSNGESSLRGFLLGTVHAKVLHHARQPVLIVRNFRPICRVLVVHRGTESDQGAVGFVAPLLVRRKPEITVLHVRQNGTGILAENGLLNSEQKLKEFGHAPLIKTAVGSFTDEILKEVATERYDLIVLSAYGQNRPKYLSVISDEALNIARLTTRPILVYRDGRV